MKSPTLDGAASSMTRVLLVLLVLTGVAVAQPAPDAPPPQETPAPPAPVPEAPPPGGPSMAIPSDPATALREANAAATMGDWARVSAYVEPLLQRSLQKNDLAEAHRLAGIAALYAQPPRRDLAEQHFLEYLKLDLDGQLDPSLYPPEVITFFSDVRVRYAPQLRARRPSKRYAILTLVPPFGQFQNGDRVKGIVIGSLLGAFLITNVTTYLVLRSWCTKLTGPVDPDKTSLGCDETTNRNDSAATLRGLNITAGVGLILTYVYGVYDGVRGYGRARRERALVPYASSTNTMTTFGVHMNF
jgi:hypothetical protein